MVTVEFLESYKNVTLTLKKRFLRKVSFSDGLEGFQQLSQELVANQTSSFHRLHALCFLAVSRCERALKDVSREGIHNNFFNV